MNQLTLPGCRGYVYPARVRVTSLVCFAALRLSIISPAYDQGCIMSHLNTPGPDRHAAWVSFDRALNALALISILGACHTLNTV